MKESQGPGPLMMTLREFADLHGISLSTARRCALGESDTYPALSVKRAGSRLYVTAEGAAEWRKALEDA